MGSGPLEMASKNPEPNFDWGVAHPENLQLPTISPLNLGNELKKVPPDL